MSSKLPCHNHCSRLVAQTDRLVLRHWRDGDAERYARHCNTAAVMHWLGGVQRRHELLDDVAYFEQCQRDDGHTFWVVERRSDGAFIGFCGFVLVPDEDATVENELEIGWRIRADEWRKGYAEEAARAAIDWAVVNLKFRRIVSRTAADNTASRALMIKLGMSHRASLDYVSDGEDDLLVVYTLSHAKAAQERLRYAA